MLPSFPGVAVLADLPAPVDFHLCNLAMFSYVATTLMHGFSFKRFLESRNVCGTFPFLCIIDCLSGIAYINYTGMWPAEFAWWFILSAASLFIWTATCLIFRAAGLSAEEYLLKPLQNPVRTNNLARLVPKQHWYTNLLLW